MPSHTLSSFYCCYTVNIIMKFLTRQLHELFVAYLYFLLYQPNDPDPICSYPDKKALPHNAARESPQSASDQGVAMSFVSVDSLSSLFHLYLTQS